MNDVACDKPVLPLTISNQFFLFDVLHGMKTEVFLSVSGNFVYTVSLRLPMIELYFRLTGGVKHVPTAKHRGQL